MEQYGGECISLPADLSRTRWHRELTAALDQREPRLDILVKKAGAGDLERRRRIESQMPAKRLGTMDELAAFTAVLLNGSDRFQTGQFFSFSGGWGT